MQFMISYTLHVYIIHLQKGMVKGKDKNGKNSKRARKIGITQHIDYQILLLSRKKLFETW